MIGFQPSLPLPPLSTIYGLLSAATGQVITPHDTFVAYAFTSSGKTVDLEKILEVEPGQPGKTNVIRREILADPELVLYVSPRFKSAFKRPHYPLLLGRSGDICTVEEITDVHLQEVNSTVTHFFGRGIYTDPPNGYHIAIMYALPVYFSDEVPRSPIGTRRFFMIEERYVARGHGVIDSTLSERDRHVMELFTAEKLGL